jgi:hypothetical protein
MEGDRYFEGTRLELGGSQHPTTEDVSSIKQRSSLEVVYDDRLDPCPGSLSFHVSLRCPAALLVKVTPTGGAIP